MNLKKYKQRIYQGAVSTAALILLASLSSCTGFALEQAGKRAKFPGNNACDGAAKLTPECMDPGNWIGFWTFFGPRPPRSYNTFHLSDARDGTVRVRVEHSSRPGVVVLETYVRKCLQGQVYRPGENDCRGAGTLDDDWGASRLRYCDAANNGCNDLEPMFLNDAGNSDAYNACAADNTAGKTWRVPKPFLLQIVVEHPEFTTLLPTVGTDYIWSSEARTDTHAVALRYGDGEGLLVKNEARHVLCEQATP